VLSKLRLVSALVTAGLVLAANAAAGSTGHAAGQIYFYGNAGNPMDVDNPPLLRPAGMVMFEDGSWLITNLRWTGWGSNTAHAIGISSASSCKPNCASGKRTHNPAQLTLSHPQNLHGHEVYGCYRLTIPATPQANQQACIGRAGNIYIYQRH
jgi:hypothetical protein